MLNGETSTSLLGSVSDPDLQLHLYRCRSWACLLKAARQQSKHECVLQAEAYIQADAVEEGAPPMLHALWNPISDDDEYQKATSLMMHLLHPDLSKRASVKQALASDFFA